MNKISVIIPYYKKIKFFEQSLNSVLNQTYKNFEVIVIYDDKNIKDLYKIKLILKKKQKKIKLIINNKNLGAGPSRNKAAKLAVGKYLAFIDSDDLWMPNKLKSQLQFMKERNLKISHTSYLIIDEKKKIIGKRYAKDEQTYFSLINSCDIGLSTVLIEKKLFLNNQFSTNKTKEDYATWLKISKKIPIYGLNEYLVLWRKTKNSLSSNNYQKLYDAFDIYYRKENFSFFKSLFCVINLSLTFLVKKYL